MFRANRGRRPVMERRVVSPAKSRYEGRFLYLVVPLFFLDVVLGWWGFHYHHLQPAGILAVVCAALQSLPIIAFIVIVALYLAEETDDFQRTLYVQSLLWGTGATMAVTTFWGGMEKYSQVAHMDVAQVQFIFIIGMLISLAANAWRYR